MTLSDALALAAQVLRSGAPLVIHIATGEHSWIDISAEDDDLERGATLTISLHSDSDPIPWEVNDA